MNQATIATPAGPLTVLEHDGVVVAAGFTAEAADLLPLVHPAVRAAGVPQRRDLGSISGAVAAYLAGDLSALDAVPVRQHGDASFLADAWRALRQVRTPITYTGLAALAGRPRAVRAAATACARNPVALFVPCHRIVRTDGGLGGYRWGLNVKKWLLGHEGMLRKTRS